METLYGDYSVARPDPVVLARTFAAVGRYASGGLSIGGLPKDLTAGEAAALHAAKVGIFSVWETYAGRPNEGFSAGVADAKAHNAHADTLGIPANVPLFYVGQDSSNPDIPKVVDYFRGVGYAGGRPVGCYGGIDVVNAVASAFYAAWFWQTEAWSGNAISPHAHLYQRSAATKPVPGCDENVLVQPFPIWLPANAAPAPAPKPKPTPTPAPIGLNVQTIDLRNVNSNPASYVHGANIAPMQRLLGIPADGVAGMMTRGALGAAQIRMFKTADFIFGRNTAEGLLAGK